MEIKQNEWVNLLYTTFLMEISFPNNIFAYPISIKTSGYIRKVSAGIEESDKV